jgi:hypothetical protein
VLVDLLLLCFKARTASNMSGLMERGLGMFSFKYLVKLRILPRTLLKRFEVGSRLDCVRQGDNRRHGLFPAKSFEISSAGIIPDASLEKAPIQTCFGSA